MTEAEGLADAWSRTWRDAFVKHYQDGVDTTHRDGVPYPGNDAIAYAVACANADTFGDALTFAGLNAEQRLRLSQRRRLTRRIEDLEEFVRVENDLRAAREGY